MKTIRIIRFVFAFYLITFISCSKDSTEENNEINYGTVQLKVNGSASILKPLTPVVEFHSDGTFSIGGINCDESKQLTLHFPPTLGNYVCGKLEGSYAELWIGEFFPCVPLFGDGPGAEIYYAIEGFVNISETSEQRVKGTFHFIAEAYGGETISVTDGMFNVLRE